MLGLEKLVNLLCDYLVEDWWSADVRHKYLQYC